MVPFSCGGASDAPSACSGVCRCNFTLHVPKGGLLHVLNVLGLKIQGEYNLNNKKLEET